MHLPADDYQPPAEDIQFCHRIVDRVAAVRPLWQQHLREELDEPMPYVFFFALALWAEKRAASHPDDIGILIDTLNDGLDNGVGDVPNLVLAGFVESMSGGTPLVPLIRGSLKPWVDYQFGIRDTPPERFP